MTRPHLLPALVVLVLAAGLVTGFTRYARSLEDRYAAALAVPALHQKTLGIAMQRAALKQPDLLPLFGSSEILTGAGYNAAVLFGSYPTGFEVARIGYMDQPLLALALQFAGDGSALAGKKVVVMVDHGTVMGAGEWSVNFSTLEGNDLAFNSALSFKMKQQIARRFLQEKRPLSKDALMEFALHELASDSVLDHAVYYIIYPLGKLNLWILDLQDHWEVLSYLRDHPKMQPAPPHHPATLAWNSLATRASAQVDRTNNNNPFHMFNAWWDANKDRMLEQKDSTTDARFVKTTEGGGSWTDLKLTLATLQELGAKPLLIGLPMNGPYYDYMGTTAEARKAYYDRLEQIGAQYGAQVLTFQDHEYDPHFFDDYGEHASAEGWVYIDQAIDAYYHGTLR